MVQSRLIWCCRGSSHFFIMTFWCIINNSHFSGLNELLFLSLIFKRPLACSLVNLCKAVGKRELLKKSHQLSKYLQSTWTNCIFCNHFHVKLWTPLGKLNIELIADMKKVKTTLRQSVIKMNLSSNVSALHFTAWT